MSIWDIVGCVFWISLIVYTSLKNDGDNDLQEEWHGAGTLHDQVDGY